jgi:hypothetical protein
MAQTRFRPAHIFILSLTLLQINRRFLLNFVIFAAWLAIADYGENSKSYSQEEGRAWAVFTL